MTTKDIERRATRVKRRLKRRKAWGFRYFSDMVDSELRLLGNKLYNKGDDAQVKFLLKRGWTVDEIIKEGRRMRKVVVKYHKKLRNKV